MTGTASDKYGVKPFDIAEHLDSEEVIAEYLTSILASWRSG
jgi:DNA-binding phage protein